MQCPKCKSHSVRYESGSRVCGVRQCTFIDVHPISYDNDVMHYEGQDRKENRFTSAYSTTVDSGGVDVQKEAQFQKKYKKGRKWIMDTRFILKLNQNVAEIAAARYLSILKIIEREKKQNEIREEEQEGQLKKREGQEKRSLKKQKHKNHPPLIQMAGYSLYSACFQKENYFEEFNICKVLKLSLSGWKDLIHEMTALLKFKLDFVPVTKPKHLIIRVCKKRSVAFPQMNAMIQMCQRIQQFADLDVRINTIAAIAFWKIIEFSQKYKDKWNLIDICKNHDKMEEENVSTSEIQRYFDVTPENVRKVFKQSIKPNFWKYLPKWDGRITYQSNLKQLQLEECLN